jgi:hypothetical protein
MTHWLQPFRIVAAIALLISLVCQGTRVLAGTTGTLSGTVTDATTHQPLAGATVSVASPSQYESVTTDASGRFAFLALAPDIYAVSVTLAGYQPTSVAGETVVADQRQTLSIATNKALLIGKVTSHAASDLVKPGTSADVYSVDATTQDKGASFGGGGNLNSDWSALAAVPGFFVVSVC